MHFGELSGMVVISNYNGGVLSKNFIDVLYCHHQRQGYRHGSPPNYKGGSFYPPRQTSHFEKSCQVIEKDVSSF